MTNRIAVLVQIESRDPRLDPARRDVSTAEAAMALREAVIDNLAYVTRIIAVMPVEQARLLMMLHEAVGEDIAQELGGKNTAAFHRPPASYKTPGKRG